MKVSGDRGVRRDRSGLRGFDGNVHDRGQLDEEQADSRMLPVTRCINRLEVPASATLCEVIAKEIGYPPEEVTPESRLAEELGLDFFDLAELVEALEERFPARISDSAFQSIRTVADIERFLRANFARQWQARERSGFA